MNLYWLNIVLNQPGGGHEQELSSLDDLAWESLSPMV